MVVQWENECMSLSALIMAQVQFLVMQSISRGYPQLIMSAALYIGLGGPTARSTTKHWLRLELRPLRKPPSTS